MAQVETLIAQVETKGVQKSAKELDKLAASADKAGDELGQAGNQAKKAGPMFKQFRGASSALTNTTGQLSVQVQDVAVQLESGTDAIRVFAQQGPQIAAIFGPQGALFGALLAVSALIAGPFVRSLFEANKAIEEAGNFIKEYSENFDELTDAQKLAKIQQVEQEIEILKDAQKDASEEARILGFTVNKMTEQMEGSEIAASLLGDKIKDNRKDFVDASAAVDTLTSKIDEKQRILDILNGRTSENSKEMERQKKKLDTLVSSITEEVAVLKLSNIERTIREIAMAGGNKALQEAIRVQLEYIESFKEQTKQQDQAVKAAEAFTDRVTSQAEKIGLTRAELILMEASQLDLNEEQRLAVDIAVELIEQEEERKAAIKETTKAMREQSKEMADFRRLVAEEQRIIEERRKAAEDEAKARAKENAERIGELGDAIAEEDEFNRQRAEREAEYNRLMVEDKIRMQEKADREEKEAIEERFRIAAQYTDGLLALEDKLMKGKTEKQKLGFRTLVNLSNAERRENAKKIISDSYAAAMAAQKALAGIPIVGPVLGAVAAGTIIAGGVSYAAQAISGGRALGGQVREGESYVVGERGPEVLTMGSNGRVIPNDKIGSASQQPVNKVANVTFNINATDASGFDRLLTQRRGQIVTIINQALTEKGKPAIV